MRMQKSPSSSVLSVPWPWRLRTSKAMTVVMKIRRSVVHLFWQTRPRRHANAMGFSSCVYICVALYFSLLLPSIGPWTQYPGLSLQDTLDRLQADVANLKRNLSDTFILGQRYTDQLQLMDSENSQLRQGLVNFLQRFATVEAQTAEMGQDMDRLQSRLQSVHSEVNQLATKSRARLGKIERANGVWRQNFKTVNKALRVLKRKIKFRVPV